LCVEVGLSHTATVGAATAALSKATGEGE
jgi:hypothetical protein